MSEPSPVLADAFDLLREDLFIHLEEAESLADQDRGWSAEDALRAGTLIGDLVHVVRALLGEHGLDPDGDCQICASAWPCLVVETIHTFLKDPQRQFVALVTRARDDG